MNECNVCFFEKPHLEFIRWHPKQTIDERAHESCTDCVAQCVFAKLNENASIPCPDCRRIVKLSNEKDLHWTNLILDYSIAKIVFYSLTYFGFRYLLSPILSRYIIQTFYDQLSVDAINYANFAEPMKTLHHPEYSAKFQDILNAISGYIEAGKKDSILTAIDIDFSYQRLITETALIIAAAINVKPMIHGQNQSKKITSISLQAFHLFITRLLMAHFELNATAITHGLDGIFLLDRLPPWQHPTRILKCSHEAGTLLLCFLGLSLLITFANDQTLDALKSIPKITEGLKNGSLELKATDDQSF